MSPIKKILVFGCSKIPITGLPLTQPNIFIEGLSEAFTIIEQRTKNNPVEVLVRAIENASLREEIASFQVGGIIVRKAVITSPQRRVDVALRLITQSSYQKALSNPKSMSQCLAEEIIATYDNDPQNSRAIKEKERIIDERATDKRKRAKEEYPLAYLFSAQRKLFNHK